MPRPTTPLHGEGVPEGTVGARSQLAALAAAADAGPLLNLPSSQDPRHAAVLMLFGVLDGLPSDHAAQARAVSRDLDVLLLARAATLRAHPGQVGFPGGRIDPGDDSAVGAALREAREETGLDPAGVEVLGALPQIPLAFSRHLVTPVLAWWRHPSPVRVVDEAESADVFRAPVADLLDPAKRGATVVRRGGQEFRSPAFLVPHATGEHLVWGFTGLVLDALFERLGWAEPWDDRREVPLVLPGFDESEATSRP
ncbi:NUDIX hydrolase [Microbacterium sp. E-13]|uniref:NUDIX hydrolase n=1 Tax=Microbacterium sp. E-13 TaxID=3404048 RepID=UPI003CF5738A